MNIQDLIQLINTQLPDNNQQLITEAVLRGVLGDMVNTLSSPLRVFNIESTDVTDNGDGTYALSGVENELAGALAFDEGMKVYQFDGTVWTLKFAGLGTTGNLVDDTDPNHPDISISTDSSLHYDDQTRQIRSNIGQSTQTFIWTGGPQEFTLVDEPAQIIYISVNGQLIIEMDQWSIDVINKKITINDQLDTGDVISINYKFIITP